MEVEYVAKFSMENTNQSTSTEEKNTKKKDNNQIRTG